MSAKTLKAFAVVGEGYGDTPDQLEVAATDGVQLAVFATIPAATDRLEFHGEEVLAVVILPVAEHEALLQEVERQKRFVEINANSAHGKHKEGQRYRDERDALQLLLNERDEQLDHEKRVSKIAALDAATLHHAWKAAEQRIDELTKHEREPVNWAAPKTVRQLIRQLQTLDPELETHALLRITDYKDGKQVRSCPLSISYERMEGPWLSSFKGEGRKVIAIWAKPDPRELQDQSETLTRSAES